MTAPILLIRDRFSCERPGPEYAITVGQITAGTVSKNPPEFKKKTPATAVKDIVANDQGDLDLGDTQYFIFTLVALAAFFIAFFHDPTKLPVLSDTLVGLTSASAAAYVAKKAVGNWTDTLVLVNLPQNLSPGVADVQVITSDGRTATLPNAFELTP